jgi:hypothetical protein
MLHTRLHARHRQRDGSAVTNRRLLDVLVLSRV